MTSSARRFTLVDGLILIAALAGGMGAVRGWVDLRSGPSRQPAARPPTRWDLSDWAEATRLGLLPLTVAVLLLALVSGRGRTLPARLATPGKVVPVAVATVTIATFFDPQAFGAIAGFHYMYFLNGGHRLLSVVERISSIESVATAVAIAWIVLAIAGAWRREDDWTGRLGRGLGIFWIGQCVLYRAVELVLYWGWGQLVM
jgi:hypothetical protein